ncbi:MAG TPA: glycogen debranching protein GlgX [Rhizomicrobium sp.]|nr:glycogen debranching protein GlgX [Rhizomicrobium sp.]
MLNVIHLPDRLESGKPHPLGASWDGLGVNFAVFSGNAEKIELCLYDSGGKHEIARYVLPEYADEVWHGYLPHASPGLLYGFRAYGPYEPGKGHRFNPAKLLLDPYAKSISGQLRWTDAVYGYRVTSARADLSMDRRDSAGAMPKAVVVDDHFSWGADKRPETPWDQTIIYEAHVKGFTQLFEKVPPPQRGTFAALSHPEVIGHLQKLGVTTIELMPVHAFLQDRALVQRGLSNYWGYNTLAFFAPEPRYLSDGNPRELREMVRRYHAAGLEVILDVVYNHTCEGSELGPTLSWRGLDNSSYYRLTDDNRHTVNDTGTGNTLDLYHPRVLQMVMDSLRYWAESFRVDGFRFDLASSLGREPSGFDYHSGFFDALRQDPTLSTLKLIAEPWDLGPDGYQLGHFPPGFAEWNDRYRDGLRRYWRGDESMRPEVAARLSGSGDLFDTKRKRPMSSINFVACHDGATLEDVVSYEGKHNEANGEDNRDGANDNYSSNYGAEGPATDPAIRQYRERVKRSMLTSLFGALGTPMILMGDECGRSQNGNNNAYCQDNEISWFDWSLVGSDQGKALSDFIARLTTLRRQFKTLRFDKFMGNAEIAPGVAQLDWWDERGVRLSPEDWSNQQGRILIMRRAYRKEDGAVEVSALMMNASGEKIDFKLPGEFAWQLMFDTSDPAIQPHCLDGQIYHMHDRAAALLVAELTS